MVLPPDTSWVILSLTAGGTYDISLIKLYIPWWRDFYLRHLCRPFSFAHRHSAVIFLNKNGIPPNENYQKVSADPMYVN